MRKVAIILRYAWAVVTGRIRHWNRNHEPLLDNLIGRTQRLDSSLRRELYNYLVPANCLVEGLFGPIHGHFRNLRLSTEQYQRLYGLLIPAYAELLNPCEGEDGKAVRMTTLSAIFECCEDSEYRHISVPIAGPESVADLKRHNDMLVDQVRSRIEVITGLSFSLELYAACHILFFALGTNVLRNTHALTDAA